MYKIVFGIGIYISCIRIIMFDHFKLTSYMAMLIAFISVRYSHSNMDSWVGYTNAKARHRSNRLLILNRCSFRNEATRGLPLKDWLVVFFCPVHIQILSGFFFFFFILLSFSLLPKYNFLHTSYYILLIIIRQKKKNFSIYLLKRIFELKQICL